MSEKRNKSDLLPLWRSISGGKKTPNALLDCQPQSGEMILVEDGECWLFNHLALRDKRERDRGAKQKPNTSSLSFSVANCGLELKVRYLTLVIVASSWFQFSSFAQQCTLHSAVSGSKLKPNTKPVLFCCQKIFDCNIKLTWRWNSCLVMTSQFAIFHLTYTFLSSVVPSEWGAEFPKLLSLSILKIQVWWHYKLYLFLAFCNAVPSMGS